MHYNVILLAKNSEIAVLVEIVALQNKILVQCIATEKESCTAICPQYINDSTNLAVANSSSKVDGNNVTFSDDETNSLINWQDKQSNYLPEVVRQERLDELYNASMEKLGNFSFSPWSKSLTMKNIQELFSVINEYVTEASKGPVFDLNLPLGSKAKGDELLKPLNTDLATDH